MKGRCPVHQGYMAGRRPVACLSLRWLHASYAVASAALRPAGRAARAGYGRVPDAAHEQNLGHAGPGPMRVGSAAAKYRGLEEKRWRTVPRRGNGASGGGVPARACSRSAARVAGGAATRHGGHCAVRGLRGAVPWPVRRAAGAGRGTCLQVCAGQRIARAVSAAVRAIWRLGARGHGHTADSVAAAKLLGVV